MTLAILFSLPWFGLFAFVRFATRFPTPLPVRGSAEPSGTGPLPSVSIVVPARNEERNIERCLASLSASEYPDFEIVVVDDRSDDRTADLARTVPRGRAHRIEVVEGRPLPEGWLGKPWACWQGAEVARGDLLLFTDADTVHAAHLLERAVLGLREERADLLTIVGRQIMETFWERLVQPQVFLAMLFRFPDFERVAANDNWRDAIANGQFILMPRSAYARVDGHRAVRDEVVEDLALAQVVKRAGLRLRIRSAEDALATRMYQSLGELVEGWSKNLIMGGLQSFPRWMRPLVPPFSVAAGLVLWLLPPLVLLGGIALELAGASEPGRPALGADEALLTWAALSVAASVALFASFARRMGAPARYGLAYPVGAAVTTFIFLRSWVRGRNVRWKGRDYRLRPASDRP